MGSMVLDILTCGSAFGFLFDRLVALEQAGPQLPGVMLFPAGLRCDITPLQFDNGLLAHYFVQWRTCGLRRHDAAQLLYFHACDPGGLVAEQRSSSGPGFF